MTAAGAFPVTESSQVAAARRAVLWLAEQLQAFVDAHPDFEVPIERLATWLARLDDLDD